ncbi:MAG TPA: Gfo/Idh/MocA family oxidoreductase [Actinomycetota bacterium]|nr:Gfo/Idh/MocA family oxidoreductase [Actinomycetota bacterium]
MRTALVGLGRMGLLHLRALRRTDALRLTAVVDPSPAARAGAAAEGVPAFASVEELLGSIRVDAAVVAAPTPTHLELVRLLAAAGVSVLCEKPCGLTEEEARQAGEAAAAAGVVLQVGYWRRFVPSLARLRDRIASGALGAVMQVGCFQWDERPPSVDFRRSSGGILVDMGVHEFDMLRWLTGQEIVASAGFAGRSFAARTVPGDPESVGVAVALSGGTVALVSLGRRFPAGDAARVEVMGTVAAEDVRFLWPPAGEATLVDALVAQAEAFAAAVRGGAVAGATADDAGAALAAAALAAGSVRDVD